MLGFVEGSLLGNDRYQHHLRVEVSSCFSAWCLSRGGGYRTIIQGGDFFDIFLLPYPLLPLHLCYCTSAGGHLLLASQGYVAWRFCTVLVPFCRAHQQLLRCRAISFCTSPHHYTFPPTPHVQTNQAQGVWKYEFDIEAPGPRTQSLHHRILREIKNKADFPGYRKGEVKSKSSKISFDVTVGNLKAPILCCYVI